MNSTDKKPSREIYGKIWGAFFTVFLVNLVCFTVIAVLMHPLWYDINEFLINALGVNWNWLLTVLIITFLIVGYGVYLVVAHLIELIKTGQTSPHIVNKILPFPILLIWNGMLILLITEAGNELSIVRVQLEYASFWLFLVVIIGFSFLLLPLLPKLESIWVKMKSKEPTDVTEKVEATETTETSKARKIWNPRTKGIIAFAGIIVVYLLVFSLPFILIPSNVLRGPLPPKPQIIAHRGASHLAPENTIAAGEMAVEWEAVGWEVDITISYDGVLFLMHDSTLRRTTNVEEVFPTRAGDPACTFNISELRQLDAGSWFVDEDPFGTIKKGVITQGEAESFRGEKIPTMEEVLNFTKENNLILDIDSKGPSNGHPYYENYTDILLTQLEESGLGKKILISSSSEKAQNMTHVCGAGSVEEALASSCELINTHHGLANRRFRAYAEAGIAVMVWTVDTPARFSQLWCLGVTYVKTNALHRLINLDNPTWYIRMNIYLIVWAVIDVTLPTGVLIYHYVLRKRRALQPSEEKTEEYEETKNKRKL